MNVKFAGFWTRILAFNTDLVVLLTLFYAVGWLITDNRHLYFTCFGLWFLYDWLFTSSTFRGTPGKRLVAIEVTTLKGNKVDLFTAFARTFSKILSFIPLLGGFTMIAFQAENRALHDLLARTWVKHKNSL